MMSLCDKEIERTIASIQIFNIKKENLQVDCFFFDIKVGSKKLLEFLTGFKNNNSFLLFGDVDV